MKIIKKIAGAVFALWAVILFIITMFPALVFYLACFFLKEPYKARWHRHVSRIWMIIFLHGVGCSIRIYGKHHFIKNKNYVVVANHNSLMDIPITTPFLPRANKTIAKKSMSKIPIFGWIYKFGSVLVDRKDEASRRKSFTEMKQMLTYGLDMLLFPEGTRNRTENNLKEFYYGAFKLAIETNKSIIPVVLFNTKKILPADQGFYFMPHTIHMHILPEINIEGKNAEQLKQEAFNVMWNFIESKKH